MPLPTESDAEGLWAILWRTLLFGPMLALFGLVVLYLFTVALALLPLYALLAFCDGRWLVGIAALMAWAIVLRFCRPICRWMSEGMEYGSL